jgi:hypothetical protein
MNDASQSAADPPAPRASTGIRGRLHSFLSARLDPKAYLELHLTIGLAVAAFGLWVFGAALDNAPMVRRDIATAATQLLGGCAAGVVWMAACITGVHIARPWQTDREHPAPVAAGEQVQPTLP